MNQKIVDYLQQNKEQYAKEDLITELRKFGFGEEEIKEGCGIVYNKQKIDYNHTKSKIISAMVIIATIIIVCFAVLLIIFFFMYMYLYFTNGGEFI